MWMLLVLLYGVLKGAREIVKKKAKEYIYEMEKVGKRDFRF